MNPFVLSRASSLLLWAPVAASTATPVVLNNSRRAAAMALGRHLHQPWSSLPFPSPSSSPSISSASMATVCCSAILGAPSSSPSSHEYSAGSSCSASISRHKQLQEQSSRGFTSSAILQRDGWGGAWGLDKKQMQGRRLFSQPAAMEAHSPIEKPNTRRSVIAASAAVQVGGGLTMTRDGWCRC